jgi:transposase
MAFRELFVVEIKEILRLWRRGRGYRAIARQTGMNRKTVHRYVDAAQAFGMSREEGSRPLDDELIAEVVTAVRPGAPSVPGLMRSHCMTYAEMIEKWVDQGCKGPKVVRLLTRHTGVPVPLRTMQRFIAEELNRGGRDSTVRIVDPPPGQILEVDFLELGWFVERGTGKRRKMYALLCTAGNSRHQFLYPALSQTQEVVIEALEAAWDFFGGVFAVIVPDNLKAVVLKADPVAPKLNPSFMEYAQSRDFEIDAARKRKPKDKARVERQVRFARDDYFKGEDFGSVEEARQAAVRWCREIAGMRDHGTTHRHPLEAFNEDELPLLKPAPTEPYDTPRWFTLRVPSASVHNLKKSPIAWHPREARLVDSGAFVVRRAGQARVKSSASRRDGQAPRCSSRASTRQDAPWRFRRGVEQRLGSRTG